MISQLISGSRLPVGSSRDEEARVVDQGAGNGRPLLLAAGELAGPLVGLGGEDDDAQDTLHGRPDPRPPRAP